jgi:hypothetical protein
MVVPGTLLASENADTLHGALQCVLLHIQVILAPYQHVGRIVNLLAGNTTSGISFLFDLITGTLKEALKMRRNI